MVLMKMSAEGRKLIQNQLVLEQSCRRDQDQQSVGVRGAPDSAVTLCRHGLVVQEVIRLMKKSRLPPGSLWLHQYSELSSSHHPVLHLRSLRNKFFLQSSPAPKVFSFRSTVMMFETDFFSSWCELKHFGSTV